MAVLTCIGLASFGAGAISGLFLRWIALCGLEVLCFALLAVLAVRTGAALSTFALEFVCGVLFLNVGYLTSGLLVAKRQPRIQTRAGITDDESEPL